ncbi:antibiotic biosynthesis monooxygenase family protein [Falsiroseomonas sp. HW251]|uniref:antibiotic biosynthesis monooxygenase family protein n=1 Tax=Falsiroseomonas sp. HW251 TaxID=3390998 RepID=UPI003D322B02
MFLEIAEIEVKPGSEAEFEAGVAKAAPLFKRAKGCHAMELQRSVEFPSRYRLVVTWETVENHMVDFRNSADFQEWRSLVGHCFAGPPEVEHTHQVLKAF